MRLAPLLLLLFLAGLAREARAAEEVFVLENGTVFRGHVIRAEDDEIEVKLSGFGRAALVTLDRRRIVNRFTPVMAPTLEDKEPPAFQDWSASARKVGDGYSREDSSPALIAPTERREERPGFFLQLANKTSDSLPRSPLGRAAIVGLFLAAVLGIILLAGRIIEVETLTAGAALMLTFLLGGLVIVDVVWRDAMLRNDRAGWIVPLQGLLWLCAAMGILRCGLGRVVVLFAFVTFVLSVGIFLTGAVLSAW